MIALYLIAIVAANLISATFGPTASIVSAFAMIGATITLRDRLHDHWRTGRTWKMAALISTGAILSWLVSGAAGRVAVASCVAFAASETVDTLTYSVLRRWPWLKRSNGSNVVSSAVDSLIFPTLAFGGFLWPIVLGQFLAKTFGGAVWSLILRRPAVAITALLLLGFASPAHGQKPPKFVIQGQIGTAHYPWNDYRPVGNVGLNALIFLPKKFSILLVGSRDLQKSAPWVGIAALQFRIWSR